MSLMVGGDMAGAVLPAVGEPFPQSRARSSADRWRSSDGFGMLRTFWLLGLCGSGGTGNTGRDVVVEMEEVVVELVLDGAGRGRPDSGGTALP